MDLPTLHVLRSTPRHRSATRRRRPTNSQGFEVGLHHSTNCANPTSPANLQSGYSSQLAAWRAKYTSVPSPTTNRTHCIVFSDWSSQPKAELANGIRLDTNYYFWPGTWVQDRPGFMNGSGIPMRFTDADGSLIDVYQTQTFMTDESDQSYPFTPNTLLDRALGPLGYYGAFTANMHTDAATTFESSRWPRVGAGAWRTRRLRPSDAHLDRRSQRLLVRRPRLVRLDAVVLDRRRQRRVARLTAMLPTSGPGGRTLSGISRGGTAVPFTTMTVKGQEYAMFAASAGSWSATYQTGGAPAVDGARVASSDGGTTLAWATNAPATSTVRFGTTADTLTQVVSTAERTTRHRITLHDLAPGGTYYYRAVSRASRRPDPDLAPGQPPPCHVPDGGARSDRTRADPAPRCLAAGRDRARGLADGGAVDVPGPLHPAVPATHRVASRRPPREEAPGRADRADTGNHLLDHGRRR